MGEDRVSYEWECPICGKSRWGLLPHDQAAVREQAKNVLLAHIRSSRGDGHASEQEYPTNFDPDDAVDYIEIGGGIENRMLNERRSE